ncbi:MAG TPA: phosphotransferase family protein [Aquabacterium sp.]|nr:phosphotransferase family protein [Aquabacterium sp.]HRH29356.1 phosphotransferase family protein [Aquabacterium sp.]
MSKSLIDSAGAVRAGEELDLAKVSDYLRAQGLILDGEPVLTQFPGGASNLTYQLTYANCDLILRRPPFGHIAKSAHDVVREARIMKALRPVYPVVPVIHAICEDLAVIGAPFYVMERLVGVIPRRELPPELGLDAPRTRQLCLNVIDQLIALHTLDPQAAGLGDLGKGEGYVARQVEGWSQRFRAARTEDVGDFESVMKWLADKQPAKEVAIRLIHNDFRFDNVVLDPQDPMKVIGVLDWEMATLGDPMMDLGSSLAYWVQADDDPFMQGSRRQPTNAPGMLTRQEVIDYYGQKTGWSVANFDFYEVYGLFRLMGIVQQIYKRFKEGNARNPVFATFGPFAHYLGQRCEQIMARSSL